MQRCFLGDAIAADWEKGQIHVKSWQWGITLIISHRRAPGRWTPSRLRLTAGGSLSLDGATPATAPALPAASGLRAQTKLASLCLCGTFAAAANAISFSQSMDIQLISAASDGDEVQLGALIERGAPIEFADPTHGRTALVCAACKGHFLCVYLLTKRGANVNAQDKQEMTALIWAALNGHTDCVRLLLDAGANKDAMDNHGNTALILAAQHGHSECVRLLVERGVLTEAREKHDMSALALAAHFGHTGCVRLLINGGANQDAKDKKGWTSLKFAARYGHTDCVRLLLAAGANTEAKDEQSRTALMSAAHHNHTNCVQLLMDHGAKKRPWMSAAERR